MEKRYSGLLAHVTSLPSHYGIGDCGVGAYWFIDTLKSAGMSLWQILPLNPTGWGNSPYSSFSAFAGNPLLIAPDALLVQGLLTAQEIKNPPVNKKIVDFSAVQSWKMEVFRLAFQRFLKGSKTELHAQFARFCSAEAHWLEDYSIFMALKTAFRGKPWYEWDEPLRFRKIKEVQAACDIHWEEILFHKFLQFIFDIQWREVHRYATSKGVRIIGDMPIFVAYDSADVWAHPEFFRLDEDRKPTVITGVPPDFFSADGQLWGNPHYNWTELQKTDFEWWHQRFERLYQHADIIRVDHFRGFEAAWEVSADATTAKEGKWKKAPGLALFTSLKKKNPLLPVIAEDLGIITPEVTKLRTKLKFPGMKILQFGLGSCDPEHEYLPHNYEYNSAVYTGTHDNDTTVGWFTSSPLQVHTFVKEYINHIPDPASATREIMRMAIASPAQYAILPIQDLFLQDSSARMNVPGKADENWAYRFKQEDFSMQHVAFLRYLTKLYNRL